MNFEVSDEELPVMIEALKQAKRTQAGRMGLQSCNLRRYGQRSNDEDNEGKNALLKGMIARAETLEKINAKSQG